MVRPVVIPVCQKEQACWTISARINPDQTAGKAVQKKLASHSRSKQVIP
jgi:hypothetical protein